MQGIPFELLELILDNINEQHDYYQCALVSKRFYSIITPRLWHTIGSPDWYCAPHLVASGLEMAQRHTDGQHRVSTLGNYIRKIYFALDDSVEDVQKVMEHAQLVEDLFMYQWLFDEDKFDWVIRNCHHLRTLSLADIEYFTTKMTRSLVNYCPKLQELGLLGIESMDHFDLSAFKGTELTRLVLESDELAALDSTILNQLEQLTSLCLNFGGHFEAAFMERLLTTTNHQKALLPRLTSFTLSTWEFNLSDAAYNNVMIPFFKSHPLLECVNLDYEMGNSDIYAAMGSFLPHLKRLIVNRDNSLNSQALQQLVKVCPKLVFIGVSSQEGTYYGKTPLKKTLDRHEIEHIRRGGKDYDYTTRHL
ncbi:hypothetical protein BC941DRAFT_430089 [Chlamydoabsidia padenii]|nr:hypothetical protein BC941DRAFT_430089 [Chlamydoabsidia padenii]